MEDGVFEAVLKGTKLHLTLKLEYKTAKDSEYQERLFDPYHIICQKGSWYKVPVSFTQIQIRRNLQSVIREGLLNFFAKDL